MAVNLFTFVSVFVLMSVSRVTYGQLDDMLESGLDAQKLVKGLEYLQKYDYIHLDAGKDGNGLDKPYIKSGIGKYQIFHNLSHTEIIDSPTLAKMDLPRCGCKDPEFSLPSERENFRYGLYGGKWNKTELTYRIFRPPRGLAKRNIRRAMKEACRMWSSRSALRFTEVRSGQADISVKFMGPMSHGDPRLFYRPMGEVGHGFPASDPALPGEIHLDASENFTFGEESDGIDLFQLLVHMIGHTLGLGHSPDPHSVMYPIVQPRDPDYELTGNDMRGLHALYGRKNRGRTRHRNI